MIFSKEWNELSLNELACIKKHQENTPIKLGALAKELGIIVKVASLSADISGQIKEENNIVTIKINKHDVKARQRYTLAHELSHFFLHRHLLKGGITDDVLYRSSQSSEIEHEANRLAADILMPPTIMKQLLGKYKPNLEGEKLIEKLAEDLELSTTAIKIRLKKV